MLIFQRAQTSTDPHTFRHEFPPPVRGRHKIKTISVRPGQNEKERKGGSTSKRSNNYGTVIISSLTFSFNRRHANSSGQLCRSEGGFPPKTNGRTALTTARGPFRGKIYENDSTLYNPCSSKKYPPDPTCQNPAARAWCFVLTTLRATSTDSPDNAVSGPGGLSRSGRGG